ncbi:MBL fold metallo-hydrolase [Paenibacillus doosanensis]|uniref:MBL fold metallo-hydrolase n=1 Tax=Paenibacillus doosanensis TaxID=1229154 RepID=UPI0021803725|nr:MBL fold metallo-hydrolase [Paenibacillus doosanensis]MCS7460282.1 MBL fold metallo-hydrolase [Paenibacillus doosanensis]
MKLQLIRHATLWLHYAGVTLLIDPMFGHQGANPPIANSANDRRNPLVPLPFAEAEKLRPDAVLVTHLHRDHWDEAAAAALPESTPIWCQPGDETAFAAAGFASITAIAETFSFQGVKVTRTSGRHGTGEIGQRMGPVSGFVLQAEGEPTLYIAGDTIWCDEVKQALDAYRPEMTVVNAGGARFVQGDPITMDADDVADLCRYAPYTRVVAVHMDAINHCLVTRADLQAALAAAGWLRQVAIPGDGEWV